MPEHGGTDNYMSPERHFEEYVDEVHRASPQPPPVFHQLRATFCPTAPSMLIPAQEEATFDGPAADIFSFGCLVFFMLRGHAPFDWECAMSRSNCTALAKRIQANDPFGAAQEDEEEWSDDEPDEANELPQQVSEAAADLVKAATRYCPSERANAAKLQTHAWLTGAAATTTGREAVNKPSVARSSTTQAEAHVNALGQALSHLGV